MYTHSSDRVPTHQSTKTTQEKIDEVARSFSKEGSCKTKITIKRNDNMMRGQRFRLCVNFLSSEFKTTPIYSEFSIVDSCLQLGPVQCTTGPTEHVEFKSDGTMIWYKEEGGQANALFVDVELKNAEGKIITGQAVPFELECLTKFKKRVDNQEEILHIRKRKGKNTYLKINPDTGKTCVVFRFEKVSSKHKGPFSLRVGPNLRRDVMCTRVSTSTSTPVEVKSKRSKESKRKLAAMKSGGAGEPIIPLTKNKKRRKQKIDKDALRVAVDHKAAVPVTNSAKILDTKIGTKAKRGMIRPSSSIVARAAETGPEKIATRNISMWVRETKNILSHLQFGLVGYGVASDGTLDSTRKILRCPSCWAQFEEKKGDADDKTKTNKHEPGCTLRVLLELYDTHIDKNLTEIHEKIGEDDDETTVKSVMMCNYLQTSDGKQIFPCFGENPFRVVGFVVGFTYTPKSTATFAFMPREIADMMSFHQQNQFTVLKRESYDTFNQLLDDVQFRGVASSSRPRIGSFVDNFEEDFLQEKISSSSFASQF